MNERFLLLFGRVPRAFRLPGWIALCVLALSLTAGSKKMDPTISVRFHAQTNTFDTSFASKVLVGSPPREVIVEKIPSISERDIASFYPYQASNGTYAVAFQLDRHGQIILESFSSAHRNSLLVVLINNRVITGLLVDRIITDGIIYVPSGITLGEIREMGKSFLITGRDQIGPGKKPKDAEDTNPLAPR